MNGNRFAQHIFKNARKDAVKIDLYFTHLYSIGYEFSPKLWASSPE
jgi:hypothetical protein